VNASIRRVGIAITVLFLILVGQLTYLQLIDASHLASDPRNVRTKLRDFNRARGEILTADGAVVARSVTSSGELKYQREYPLGALFGQISGYQSFVLGNTGVESTYNSYLTGRNASLNSLGNLISGKSETGNVVLSLTKVAQQAAADALGSNRGSVVALDVKTGAVLAMYSNPSYDPSLLASHQTTVVQQFFNALNSSPDNPALPRAYREHYPPGSTFKVLTSAAALETGTATIDSQYPVLTQLTLPQTTNTLQNFGGESCGGSLLDSFVVSCNTTFGQVGLQLGDKFPPALAACGVGVGEHPPIDLDPGAVDSVGPAPNSFRDNQPLFAFAGIGQGDVTVTPLEMALVAEGVANGGVIIAPHVVSQIQNADGTTVKTIDPTQWKTCMPGPVAATVTQMMIQVVQRGTGVAAQIPGVAVAGKTGTAQAGNGNPHAWFITFAPADAPRYAVAVIVEHGGTNAGDTATGGVVAAPIAAQVLRVLLGK
jgi:peptidoglycan glycosyltransferase